MIKCRMKNRGPSFVPNSRHARNSRAPLMRQFYTGVGNTEGRLRTRRWLVLDDDLWPRTLESETRPCLGTRGPRLSPEARAPFSFSSPFFFPHPPPPSSLFFPLPANFSSSLASPFATPHLSPSSPSPFSIHSLRFRRPLHRNFARLAGVMPCKTLAHGNSALIVKWRTRRCLFLPSSSPSFSLFFSSIYYRSTGHPPWGTRDERFLGVIRDSILGSTFKGRLEYFDRLRFRYG